MDTEKTANGAGDSSPAHDGSQVFRVHDALGNWMVEDVRMERMICVTTRKRDAEYIAAALRAFDPPNVPLTGGQPPQGGSPC